MTTVEKVTLHHMATQQRKLLVALIAYAVLVLGFGAVVFIPTALEAYRVMCEWAVYLAAFFGGANALTYWAQRGQPGAHAAKAAKLE